MFPEASGTTTYLTLLLVVLRGTKASLCYKLLYKRRKPTANVILPFIPVKIGNVVLRKGKRKERKKGDIMNGETKMEFSSK